MTATLPANVTYGTVTGRYITAIGDTPGDPDALPDPVPAAGQVIFTPGPQYVLDPSGVTVIIPLPIISVLDSMGYLTSPGNPALRSVSMIASDNPALNPTNWTYRADFQLVGVTIESFYFQVLGNQNVDLSSLMKLPASTGVITLGIPQTDKGIPNGIATLDAFGHAKYAEEAPGSRFDIPCPNGVQPLRATRSNRTDIFFDWLMVATPSTAVGYAIVGDGWRRVST